MRDLYARLTDSEYTRMLRWKEQDGYGDQGWEDWFRYKTANVSLTKNADESIQANTASKFHLWVNNSAHNLAFWLAAHDHGFLEAMNYANLVHFQDAKILVPPEWANVPIENTNPSQAAIIVGRGPSIFKHEHLRVLAEWAKSEPLEKKMPAIIATDGMLVECLKAGVTPDEFPDFYVLSIDGDKKLIVRWYGDPNGDLNDNLNRNAIRLVNQYGKGLKVIVGSTVANNVIIRCLDVGAKVYMLHPLFDNYTGYESITRVMMESTQTDETGPLLTGQSGGNAGTMSAMLGWSLLRRSPIILIGMTFGYEPETKIEDTAYASKVLSMGDLDAATHGVAEVKNPYDGLLYKTDGAFTHYRKSFIDMLDEAPPPPWVKIWNCTEGGILFGHKRIEWKKFAEALSEI